MLVTIDANAKINLTLDILGKRTDGYHEVAMVMQEISLADTLRLERAQAGIHLRLDVPGLPADHRNLAWRAARLIMETYSLNDGVRIELQKRIPIAAGLARRRDAGQGYGPDPPHPRSGHPALSWLDGLSGGSSR